VFMSSPFHNRSIGTAHANGLRADAFAPSLVASIALHLTALVLVAALSHRTTLTVPNSIPVILLESPQRQQDQTALRDQLRPNETTKPEPQLPIKRQAPIKAPAAPAKLKDEPVKPAESKAPAPPKQSVEPERGAEANGGAPAGTSAFSFESQTDLVTGPGSGGGGGHAVAGLGRGSGTPGAPVQTAPLRTNREAKPIQTARAFYPPMALRMGMESDVTLRIEVDPAGNVTKAEILKSGGGGFDEEALKAVKQSRFEPAQKDGQNVAAEFNYIYRFRLQR
jgi:periplasmic protein TonB